MSNWIITTEDNSATAYAFTVWVDTWAKNYATAYKALSQQMTTTAEQISEQISAHSFHGHYTLQVPPDFPWYGPGE